MALHYINTSSETSVKSINDKLEELPKHMKFFSKALLALDSEFQVSSVSGERPLVKFNEIRGNTRKNALVYSQEILPVASKVIANLSNYFEYYKLLEYEQWKTMLPVILKDVRKHKNCCSILISYHEDILSSLKQLDKEALINFKNMKELETEYRLKIAQLKDLAEDKNNWAKAVLTIGGIVTVVAAGIATGGAATAIFAAAGTAAETIGAATAVSGVGAAGGSKLISDNIANNYRVDAEKLQTEALAKQRNAQILGRASGICQSILIPALSGFIEGLNTCAAFFSETEQKLEQMQGSAENAIQDQELLYFLMMKSHAECVTNNCTLFARALPDIRSDLTAIRTDPSDANYVDAWRRRQLSNIEKQYASVEVETWNKIKSVFFQVLGTFQKTNLNKRSGNSIN